MKIKRILKEFSLKEFNEKDIKKTNEDFVKAIFEYEKEFGGQYSIFGKNFTLSTVRSRVRKESSEWDDIDDVLVVTYGDTKSDFFWTFEFKSPTDKVDVSFAGD